MRVTFITDACVRVEGQLERLFKIGDIEELSDASAQRWIRRNVAVEAEAKPVARAKKARSKKG
jgi:hypothetical protein